MLEHHRLALVAALTVLTAADLTAPAVVEAQDEAAAPAPSSSTMRFTLGLGGGYPSAFGATLGLAYERSGHVGAVRASTSAGVFEDTYSDIALLYGRTWRSENGLASVSAGPAYVRNEHGSCVFCGAAPPPESTVGVALAADLTYAPWSRFGLGVAAFGNINGKQTFGGVALTLSVGRLR